LCSPGHRVWWRYGEDASNLTDELAFTSSARLVEEIPRLRRHVAETRRDADEDAMALSSANPSTLAIGAA
jgi:hypothetical protein